MVLFHTEFVISDELDYDYFLQMVKEWISNSQYYNFSFDYDGTDHYQQNSEDGKQSIVLYKLKDCMSVILRQETDDCVYTNSYVIANYNQRRVMSILLSRDTLALSCIANERFYHKPLLMKQLFWQELGGLDDDIMTEDKAIMLRKQNLSLAKKIISANQSDYILPIVYISVMSTCRYKVNYDALASALAGMAHVVVESNPYIANCISKETENQNPQQGNIRIYGKNGMLLEYSEHVSIKEIVTYVEQLVSSVKIPEELNCQYIQYQYLLEQMQGNNDLTDICDSLLADKDSEIASLKQELSQVKSDFAAISAKANSLEFSFSQQQTGNVSFVSTEKPLYENELQDVILKVLQKECNLMDEDTNLKKSRKYDVLSDILENNKRSGMDESIKEVFKSACKEGCLSKEGIKNLELLGFSILKDTSRHYKVAFNGDTRYQMSLACTPSDYRSGNNAFSTYMNLLFGY